MIATRSRRCLVDLLRESGQQEPREKETCKLGTVEGKTRKGLAIPADNLC
jgi:hypothetical protein